MAAGKETSIGVKLIADLKNYQTGMQSGAKMAQRFGKDVKSGISDASGAIQSLLRGDITALPKIFSSAASAAGGFSKGLQGVKIALISTGIGALIVALGAAIAAVTQYFKGSEEGQIAWAKTMNSIKAVTEPILAMFGKFGKAIVQMLKGDFKGAWETAKGAVQGVDDAIKDNISNLGELNALEEKIVKTRRQSATDEKRLMAEISELRNKAKDTENYTAQQNLAFADMAIKKQKELSAIRNNLASEELQLAEYKAAQGDNDIATNDMLVDLQNRKLEIQKQEADGLREIMESRRSIAKLAAAEVELNKQASFYRSAGNVYTIESKTVTTKFDSGPVDSSQLDDMSSSMARVAERATQMKIAMDAATAEENAERISTMSGLFGQLGSAIGGTTGSFLGLASTLMQLVPQLIAQIVALTTAQVSSSQAISVAKGSEAIASGTAASQAVPFPFNIISLAVTIASIIKALATPVRSFAAGGIAYGETFARVGEYAGARSNPEVIAPLDKLQSIISTGNSSVTMLQPVLNFDGEKMSVMLKRVETKVNKRT